MSEKIPPIAGALLYTSGLGINAPRAAQEEKSLGETKNDGVVNFGLHSYVNFETQNSNDRDRTMRMKIAFIRSMGLGSLALVGVSAGALESLIHFKRLRDELIAEDKKEEADGLSAYLITPRLRGSDELKEEDYVDPDPEKSFTTPRGFKAVQELVVKCEVIVPKLTLDDKKRIRVLVAMSDDRILHRDSKIPDVPLYPIIGADSHEKAHGQFCKDMGAHLAAVNTFNVVRAVNASRRI